MSGAPRLSTLLLALLTATVVGLAGCGGSGRPQPTAAGAHVPPTGATVRAARCMLWNVLDRTGRMQLIAGLRGFFGQRLDTGARVALPADTRAYRVITSYCRLPFAGSFLVYRLYGNATGFLPPSQG